MILALKKSSLNLFITIVTIDWFSFKTDITVNFVQLKKITNSFFQPGEEDEVLRGHGVGHLQLSRDQGRWEEKNQWNDKKKVKWKKKKNETIKKGPYWYYMEVLYLDSIFRPNPKLSIWGELFL